jgi:hypothetical protein
MINILFEQFFDFFDGHTVFNVLDAIMRYEKKFDKKDDRDAIEKLYIFMMELSESYNSSGVEEDTFFSEEEENIIELYYIPVII